MLNATRKAARAHLFRLIGVTALCCVMLYVQPASAIDTDNQQTLNGYMVGRALLNDVETDPDSMLQRHLKRLSPAGKDVYGGPFAGFYSPRDSLGPVYLDDLPPGDFTPGQTSPDNGMLGLVYEVEKWQIGAGYSRSPRLDREYGLLPDGKIDRYMLGTRYNASGGIGLGAGIELRDHNGDHGAKPDDEQIFTFGTFVHF